MFKLFWDFFLVWVQCHVYVISTLFQPKQAKPTPLYHLPNPRAFDHLKAHCWINYLFNSNPDAKRQAVPKSKHLYLTFVLKNNLYTKEVTSKLFSWETSKYSANFPENSRLEPWYWSSVICLFQHIMSLPLCCSFGNYAYLTVTNTVASKLHLEFLPPHMVINWCLSLASNAL